MGAAEAPAAFRSFLPKIGTLVNAEFGIDLQSLRVSDFGDINPKLELEEAHKLLTHQVGLILASGAVPFVIGGGNDQSYANASALIQKVLALKQQVERESVNSGHRSTTGNSHSMSSAGCNHDNIASTEMTPTVGVINIDAHLDVRPLKDGKAHSGSPFRQLLEDPNFTEVGGRFVEFACQGHQCSQEHWKYVQGHHNAILLPLSELRGTALGGLSHQQRFQRGVEDSFYDLLDGTIGDHIFVSFDIDSIQSSDCPGVSAPANIGLTTQEALNICFLAGKSPRVKLVDVSEYNPKVEEYRTGRLVVLMFYYFLLGYAQRGH